MEAAYQPQPTEQRWRQRWAEMDLGAADPASSKPAFSIALPPPNITGSLHMGHALNALVQDSLCRFYRMNGYEVCWVPGTDHAAIATQNVIERQLADEGTSKEELGREAFATRVDAWYRTYQGRILEQLQRLGATCDWRRERFTLDDAYVRVIRIVFGELYRQGLIYRGPRIVNWCPRCRSAISDEEVEYQEQLDTFYYVRYPLVLGQGSLEVATTRPETILADVAVAVAPGDERFRRYVGQSVRDPLGGREIPVIEDQAVDPQVGTGVLKITPGHSAEDYEIGERHHLPIQTVISLDGLMIAPGFPDLDGRGVGEAREIAAARLRESGAMIREEPLLHQVGHCDRCGTVIEPLVTPQWWVRIRDLADPAGEAVASGKIKIHPAQFRVQYLDWVAGLRDWCISRQLWLGHRIPVSTCANGHSFAWVDEPAICPECSSSDLTADPDVLDTWFSSGLWPFAILGWPDPNPTLERFYPTSVLSTARDILQHWVVRMVMMGLRFTSDIPFHDVLFHATILGADGARMSKSRGNVVDPLDMVDKYGADALRAWGASVAMGTQDARFDETRVEGYSHFANKLWNMTRLLYLVHFPGEDQPGRIPETAEPARESLQLADRWILSRLGGLTQLVTKALPEFDFGGAMDAIYGFAWHELADWYLELVKARLETGDAVALWVTRRVLLQMATLLHPIMPFLTDALAEQFAGTPASLDRATWPAVEMEWIDPDSEMAMAGCMNLISSLRKWLTELGIEVSKRSIRVPFFVREEGPELAQPEALGYVSAVLPITWVEPSAYDGRAARPQLVAGRTTLALGRSAGPGADRWKESAQRELVKASALRAKLEAHLDGPFAEKAPAEVVQRERDRLEEVRQRQVLLTRLIES
ncbi:MAG TPA: valine--tRNA ligase [Candidatus Dormibacteraeota bacterium]|nr:valine--tRNA ligase [Candidatus Dormibacteraeota bacterium]